MKAQCVHPDYMPPKSLRDEMMKCVRHSDKSIFKRLAAWIVFHLEHRRAIAQIAAMDERELHDIGLYNRDLPHLESIEHDNPRRKSMAYDGWIAGS